MARPTTKIDLQEASEKSFMKLMTCINDMPEAVILTPLRFDDDKLKEAHWRRDKSVKDVLIHLYEWHELLLHWIQNNLEGNEVPFLPDPYNWKSYGAMNVTFIEKHQMTTFETAKAMLIKSHAQVMSLIDTLSNDALFSKAYFNWAPTSTVGSYCVSSTTSHYEWAYKKLNKHLKMNK
ncbi:ClbS/DfsB family four-helix bundle protein [Erysipelothrix anatis]|uniref:ClbS/DfsB family four-helix bundle protein n=1 Tax=Erysipelothrix anatis TaxID=2683713 RepID=UPI00135771ED|nr:ClbS/DfsB family four-helix bundle protein [Erysipelothrix anatis]